MMKLRYKKPKIVVKHKKRSCVRGVKRICVEDAICLYLKKRGKTQRLIWRNW